MSEPSCNLRNNVLRQHCRFHTGQGEKKSLSGVQFTALGLQVRIAECLRCCAEAFVKDRGFRRL